jgi:hypothetical protein
MIAPRGREHRMIVLAMIAWGCAANPGSAQDLNQRSPTTPSFAAVKARVTLGDVVYLTDTSGATIKGKLAELTDDAVRVMSKAEVRTVAAADVRRIQWQQPDSPFTGVLIGAAVGAIPGVYWLLADPNECGGMCPEEYALIAVGAVAGGVIDHVIKRKVTVYTSSSGRPNSVTIGPFVMRDRRGLQVAVTF